MIKPHVKRVLVIDDDETLLLGTARLLKMAGYEVATRSSELGTLAAVNAERPDVVLLDLNMPLISGDRLAALLQDARHTLPVIIIYTGIDEHMARARAARCGAHGCILKGCSPEEFIAEFKRIIATRSPSSNSKMGDPEPGTRPAPEGGSRGRRR